MANQIDETKALSETRVMSGRRVIKSSVSSITENNVQDVLLRALETHALNRSEIDYLWKYYKGDQPIRHRVKETRPEICNKIVENRANEIVSFKVGYLCGEPIQYVSRNGGEEVVNAITTLNEFMFAEDKSAQDQELVDITTFIITNNIRDIITENAIKNKFPLALEVDTSKGTYFFSIKK